MLFFSGCRFAGAKVFADGARMASCLAADIAVVHARLFQQKKHGCIERIGARGFFFARRFDHRGLVVGGRVVGVRVGVRVVVVVGVHAFSFLSGFHEDVPFKTR